MQHLLNKLTEDISKLGLIPDEDKTRQLLSYIELLIKWNKTYSLTAINNINDILKYHILDGLAVVPYLEQFINIIDIGSGMGVPGIILAIWQPKLKVSVLDSNSKKTAFLQQVKIELNLANLSVINSRVEEYDPVDKFDIAISRAFSSSQIFINLVTRLIKPGGFLMLMKGQNINDELKFLTNRYVIIDLDIPKISEKRFLLKIEA